MNKQWNWFESARCRLHRADLLGDVANSPACPTHRFDWPRFFCVCVLCFHSSFLFIVFFLFRSFYHPKFFSMNCWLICIFDQVLNVLVISTQLLCLGFDFDSSSHLGYHIKVSWVLNNAFPVFHWKWKTKEHLYLLIAPRLLLHMTQLLRNVSMSIVSLLLLL